MLDSINKSGASAKKEKLPSWFRQEIPNTATMKAMKDFFKEQGLNTVCEGAKCPNVGQCWQSGVATFMILGTICTRSCRFCAVRTGIPIGISNDEPHNIALAVKKMKLKYVVITSVTRDDLKDGGVNQYVKTVQEIRSVSPNTKIELLIPDYALRDNMLESVVASKPDVIGHNIETVKRLFPKVRPQANYKKSLQVLKNIKFLDASIFIKSGFMVGFGEVDEEIDEVLDDLIDHSCDMITIGQYLAPDKADRYVNVEKFVSPNEFDDYKKRAYKKGFKSVMSGPLVRSSYLAEHAYKFAVNEVF